MKCNIQTGTGTPGKVIRRKFVPIKMMVEREGHYLQVEEKLPFTANKVVGVLTTTRMDAPCNGAPAPKRVYYGLSDIMISDSGFTKLSDGTLYKTAHPPDVSVPYGIKGFWYYAHLVSDGTPFYFGDDIQGYLEDPIIVPVLAKGHCKPDLYSLWSGYYSGGMDITYSPEL